MDPVNVLLWIAVISAGLVASILAVFAVLFGIGLVLALTEKRRKRAAVAEAAERILRQNG